MSSQNNNKSNNNNDKRIIYIRKRKEKPNIDANNIHDIKRNLRLTHNKEKLKNMRHSNKTGTLIKLEIPYHLRCGKCDKMIAKGITTKAVKKRVYKKKEVSVFSFKIHCMHCKTPIEFITDEDNTSNLIIDYGCRKYFIDNEECDETEITVNNNSNFNQRRKKNNSNSNFKDYDNSANKGFLDKFKINSSVNNNRNNIYDNANKQKYSLCSLFNKKQRLKDDLILNDLVSQKLLKEKEIQNQNNSYSKYFTSLNNDKARIERDLLEFGKDNIQNKNDYEKYLKEDDIDDKHISNHITDKISKDEFNRLQGKGFESVNGSNSIYNNSNYNNFSLFEKKKIQLLQSKRKKKLIEKKKDRVKLRETIRKENTLESEIKINKDIKIKDEEFNKKDNCFTINDSIKSKILLLKRKDKMGNDKPEISSSSNNFSKGIFHSFASIKKINNDNTNLELKEKDNTNLVINSRNTTNIDIKKDKVDEEDYHNKRSAEYLELINDYISDDDSY